MSLRDLLPLYALGALDDDEARAIERALAVDPDLRAELAAHQHAAAALAGTLPGVAPSASVRVIVLEAQH